jgi:hypothetical protein
VDSESANLDLNRQIFKPRTCPGCFIPVLKQFPHVSSGIAIDVGSSQCASTAPRHPLKRLFGNSQQHRKCSSLPGYEETVDCQCHTDLFSKPAPALLLCCSAGDILPIFLLGSCWVRKIRKDCKLRFAYVHTLEVFQRRLENMIALANLVLYLLLWISVGEVNSLLVRQWTGRLETGPPYQPTRTYQTELLQSS